MKKARWMVAALCALMVLSGCGSSKEKEEVLVNMEEKMDGVTSMEAVISLNFDIREKTGESAAQYGVSTDIIMEMTKDPAAVHIRALSQAPGEASGDEAVTEGYSLYEDGVLTSYTKAEDGWERSRLETKSDYQTTFSEMAGMATHMLREQNRLRYKRDNDTVEGKEAYCFEGTLDISAASDLLSLVDLDGSYTGLMKDQKASVRLWVYKDSYYPAKIEVDMTNAMKNLYEKMIEEEKKNAETDIFGETTEHTEFTVNAFTVSAVFTSFNETAPIELPDENTEHIVEVEPADDGETTLEEWREYVLGEAEKFGVDVEKLFDLTEDKMDGMKEEEWESLLYEIYKEAGLYGELEE